MPKKPKASTEKTDLRKGQMPENFSLLAAWCTKTTLALLFSTGIGKSEGLR